MSGLINKVKDALHQDSTSTTGGPSTGTRSTRSNPTGTDSTGSGLTGASSTVDPINDDARLVCNGW